MRKTAIKTLFDSIFVIHLPPFFFSFSEKVVILLKSRSCFVVFLRVSR